MRNMLAVPLLLAAVPAMAADGACPEAWFVARTGAMRGDTNAQSVAAIREHCAVGATIRLPAASSGVIMAACDMSGPVVNAGPDVVCRLASPATTAKPARARR